MCEMCIAIVIIVYIKHKHKTREANNASNFDIRTYFLLKSIQIQRKYIPFSDLLRVSSVFCTLFYEIII